MEELEKGGRKKRPAGLQTGQTFTIDGQRRAEEAMRKDYREEQRNNCHH